MADWPTSQIPMTTENSIPNLKIYQRRITLDSVRITLCRLNTYPYFCEYVYKDLWLNPPNLKVLLNSL